MCGTNGTSKLIHDFVSAPWHQNHGCSQTFLGTSSLVCRFLGQNLVQQHVGGMRGRTWGDARQVTMGGGLRPSLKKGF